MRKPNILWICTDQQRWDTIHSLNNNVINTPRIDGLVREGVAFNNAYTPCPVCTPSRVSFLTGLYPATHHVFRNGIDFFPSSLPLVTGILADNGYHGGLVGKLHLSRCHGRREARPENDGYAEYYWSHYPYADYPEGHDYDQWLDEEKGVRLKELNDAVNGPYTAGISEEYHQTTWASERSKDFIRRNGGSPWFLSVNVFDPHPPFDPPANYMERYHRDDMPYPLFKDSDIEHQARYTRVDQQTRGGVDPTRYNPRLGLYGDDDVDPSDMHWIPPSNYDAKQIKACYYAMIELIDTKVGEILDTLEETGQRENTIVIFTSDHGEMLGDHGILYKGCRFFEGLTHVPLVFSCPGTIKENLTASGLTDLVDMPKTILDFAGIDAPDMMQGRSLRPILTGGADPAFHKDFVVSHYNDSIVIPNGFSSHGTMVFDGRYKTCLYHDANLGEIYDLQNDPDEFHDLWWDKDARELKSRLISRHVNALMTTVSGGPRRTGEY